MKLITVIFCLIQLAQPALAETTQSGGNDKPSGGAQGPARNIAQINVCNNEFNLYGVSEAATIGPQTCQMALDPDFAKIMQELFPRCARETALKLGMNVPVKVTAFQMGAFNVRKINTPDGVGDKWSRHSTGKAIDIEALDLDFGDGRSPTRVKLTEGSNNQPFYDGFRECWANSTLKDANGKSCTCSIGAPGTKEPCNDVHKDHAHFSVSCPTMPGVAGC